MAATVKTRKNYATDAQRWPGITEGDAAAHNKFFYSVKTTGVYCRPSCKSRLPHRHNVAFYRTAEEAQAAGFRACKRCKPKESSVHSKQASIVTEACRLIVGAQEPLSLEQLAESVGMSPYHFHRVFKAQAGLTPKEYASAHRDERMRAELSQSKTVTSAIYNAGFNSNGR